MSVNHYENFPVASWLCPPALRPSIVAIYGFARTADDLADEGETSAAQRLADLADYRADLKSVCVQAAPSPRWFDIFSRLGATLEAHALPVQLLTDLLSAFEQDVVKHSYANRGELLDYCRRSANPVGRLLLHLYGVKGNQALQESDAICTALQLINFWQDAGVDARRGRVYLPATDCSRHGVTHQQVLTLDDGPNVRAVVAEMVGWARELMSSGAPLVHKIPGRAGWELRLVVQGGLRILDRIEGLEFATLRTRPALNWTDTPLLTWRAIWMRPAASAMAEKSA